MNIGYSSYLEKQEEFVERNRDKIIEYLNINSRSKYKNIHVDAKLRQLFAGSDNNDKNRGTYINNNDWDNIKILINLK